MATNTLVTARPIMCYTQAQYPTFTGFSVCIQYVVYNPDPYKQPHEHGSTCLGSLSSLDYLLC
jgi:hypothetical protein